MGGGRPVTLALALLAVASALVTTGRPGKLTLSLGVTITLSSGTKSPNLTSQLSRGYILLTEQLVILFYTALDTMGLTQVLYLLL